MMIGVFLFMHMLMQVFTNDETLLFCRPDTFGSQLYLYISTDFLSTELE